MVAMAENRVIGRDGALPWHLPADFKRLKRLTIGHTLVMGRKTFDSIGKPLPGRRSIVLTRDPAWHHPGVDVAHRFDDALAMAAAAGEDEIFVFGGAGVFRRALPRADRLYQTLVHAEVEGDVYFPPFDPADWQLVEDQRHPADPRHAYDYSFRRFERRRPAPP